VCNEIHAVIPLAIPTVMSANYSYDNVRQAKRAPCLNMLDNAKRYSVLIPRKRNNRMKVVWRQAPNYFLTVYITRKLGGQIQIAPVVCNEQGGLGNTLLLPVKV